MLIFAHRGCSGTCPENTMFSFQHAEKTGCYGIELDVQLTKDGKMVIIHDETIDRTSNGTGFVKDFTYDELKQYDFSGDYVGQFGTNRIPLMEEYLDWVSGTGLVTNIELKNSICYYDGLEEKLIAAVRAHGLEKRVLFSSFNNVSIVRCRKLAPEIRSGFLLDSPIWNPGAYVSENGADCFHPDQKWLTAEHVKSCHDRGVSVNVWTVNTPKVMQRMQTLGVDGIFSNFPEKALAYFKG